MAGYPGIGEDFGPYRIEREIGYGGMGVVFEATEADLGRRVALKVMAPHLARLNDYRTRFHR